MDLVRQVKQYLEVAEVYRNQGLMLEARGQYEKALEVFQNNPDIPNSNNLSTAVKKKIFGLDNAIEILEQGSVTPEVSEKTQNLIKKLFSFSQEDDKDLAELEGALALAKFGQFEKALTEFNKILEKEPLRVVASKNILRCHFAISSAETVVDQFRQWLSNELFSKEHLKKIRFFLKDFLEKKDITIEVPQISESEKIELRSGGDADFEFDDQDQEILDISSIGIKLDTTTAMNALVEFDVSFQSGNIISLIISSKEKALIDNLKIGLKLNDVQCYSSIAMFTGSGIIASKTEIRSGPKKGDYCLDIKMVPNK